MFRNLVACTDIKGVANEITASSGNIPIKTGVGTRARIAIKEIVKAIRTAGKPEPTVTAVYTQVRGRLKLKLDFGRLDVFENNVIVRRPGPRKTKEPLKAIVYTIIGMPIAAFAYP